MALKGPVCFDNVGESYLFGFFQSEIRHLHSCALLKPIRSLVFCGRQSRILCQVSLGMQELREY